MRFVNSSTILRNGGGVEPLAQHWYIGNVAKGTVANEMCDAV